ncbi:MAG: hypothetical protein PHW60_04305 [Kiritimatiellae bacterium]|nr:hypothetical protein [Kiritimatiellia bacterium]
MKVKAHKLRDRRFANWTTEVADRWDYADMLADRGWRKDWISFDCCAYVPETKRVYCGITSFDADIFWAYDRPTRRFVDCAFGKVRNPYDAKFHRSLVRREKDGCLYAAIALLHDADHYWEAPGGALVRYNPATGDICKLAVPLPHIYIQSICLDQKRGMIYGQAALPERMFKFDLNTGRSEDLGPLAGMGFAQGENIELDADGCAWCGWMLTRAWQSTPGVDANRLCKYDPRLGRIIYFKKGLPNPDKSYGFQKVEGIFNLGGGKLFASGGNGSIYRINLKTGMGLCLGTPIRDRRSRLSSLTLSADGMAYGVTGRDGRCEVIRFDPHKETYKLLGAVTDGRVACWQVHCVVMTPEGVLFACENDNPHRSGYLWEIKL